MLRRVARGIRRRPGWPGAKVATLLGFALALASARPAFGEFEPFALRKGDVVAFTGGTDMARIQREGRLEAALTERFRQAAPKFRDLSWEGDTVYFQSTVGERWRRGAFGGWKEQLKKVGATVVVAQFGKIESLDGPDELDAFIRAYEKLLDEWRAAGCRVVLLAPAPFQWDWADDSSLRRYGDAVALLAGARRIPCFSHEEQDPVSAFMRHLAGAAKEPPPALVAAVRAKHRLWREYWRPANWKCLFGDDHRRVFSNAAHGLPSFKSEWETYPQLIEAAEAHVLQGKAPVEKRPSPLTGSKEADPEKERAAFEVPEGFEVNLFADETLGIANPLSIRWDAAGVAYVACSDVYPQLEPGVAPNDRIVRLVDADGDGRADESNLYATGLAIPTGMEVDEGRVYVGQGTDLLLLTDEDGDGSADRRETLLGGFGNGDSHQTINSFVWSPDGELWFCQGDGIESRVETPFGVSTLFQAGVFRLRPRELRLDGLLDDFMGPGNPWGIAFDAYGQAFVADGAGGVSYLTPASIPAKRKLRLPRIGRPGGYCGIERAEAENLPEDFRGNFLLGDYKRNQVSRFAVAEDGAGFRLEWRAPLLRSRHRNFRPIDVKVGPDGAIYVVDWYNPITCHQDDFYRHPARDKTHGRIWRVVPKAGPLPPPKLRGASADKLLAALESAQSLTRLKAKQVLARRPAAEVKPALLRWAARDEVLLEAGLALAWMNETDEGLLRRLLVSADFRERAYAARLAGRFAKRLKKPWALLETAARDEHPRVRMEAALACAQVSDARAVLVAATVAEFPRDRWIDYALSQAFHHLKPHWLPAFRRGELDFGERRRGLAAALGQSDSGAARSEIRKLLAGGELEEPARVTLMKTLVGIGEDADLRAALEWAPPRSDLLDVLAGRERPGFDPSPALRKVVELGPVEARASAWRLVGRWKVRELLDAAVETATSRPGADEARAAALALGGLGGEEARKALESLGSRGPEERRGAALVALLKIDPERAAELAAGLLAREDSEALARELFAGFVARSGGGRLLAEALGESKPEARRAQRLSALWNASGLADEFLSKRLSDLAGAAGSAHSYSAERARALVSAARKGDPLKGRALFRSARLGCSACHKVGEEGGNVGPDLSALGGAVPPERIVTETLWPRMQVKEGYALSRIVLKDGSAPQGYLQGSRRGDALLLRDVAGEGARRIPRERVERVEQVGSLMPPTARNLSEQDLAHLLKYLFNLR